MSESIIAKEIITLIIFSVDGNNALQNENQKRNLA